MKMKRKQIKHKAKQSTAQSNAHSNQSKQSKANKANKTTTKQKKK
jgi:hypothetical protein